ncbi:hypothetical protein IWX64_003304 [Arthrobacter sp. CAN_A212]|uniref:DUF3800 domain-containing protein n=1 Tax=Arthrobacter flavus TaxID=95172 RepID=A0ABW4Q9V6_9MICC
MQDSKSFELHAWVDESMRPTRDDERMYLLGAVVADPSCCQRARDELRGVLPRGARKLHWTDMGDREKRRVTGLIADLDMAHLIVVGTPLNYRKQEHARAKCMERLLWELGQLEVNKVFLEQRTQSLNKRDMALIEHLRGSRSIPPRLRVYIEQPSTEPMLWIPDQVLGALGDAESKNNRWMELYNGVVERIDIVI